METPESSATTLASLGQLRQLLKSQFGRFALVGATATGFQYLLLICLAELTPLNTVACSALAFGISALFNYLANYYITFKSDKRHAETLSRFTVVAAIGLAINTLVFYVAEFALPHYLLSQGVATIITLISNFLLHKYWIYK
ncbi:GtrA family protein [Gilvimarinus polysaccharolyticus]|uniref:GtrA family protein n=1 Tax=Gilvimarinus polysaccharolyticus TaxID=863921 RepID=UPI000673507C|nr:GtrA family protein [Gilvimarinus polysaccharolyticus]